MRKSLFLLKSFWILIYYCYNEGNFGGNLKEFKKGKVFNLKITDVRIRLVTKEDSKLKAVASITIDDELVVHDIKIINGKDGYFLSMPNKFNKEGKRIDTVHPTRTDVRESLKALIVAEYEKALANADIQ